MKSECMNSENGVKMINEGFDLVFITYSESHEQ